MIKILGNRNKGKFYGYIQNQKNDRMGHGSDHDRPDDKCFDEVRGAEREGQAVETSQVEDTSHGVMRIHRHGKNMPENLLR
ncbi:MAG: hypothetical protein ACLVCH_03210 [Roseburia inulinivorans]